MQPNPMNQMIRQAGNRSRALPNIGQNPTPAPGGVGTTGSPLGNTPASKVADVAMMAQGQSMPGTYPQMQSPTPLPPAQPGPSPMAAPNVQPSTFTLHPSGSPPDPDQYNYEPQPDGAWRVYPPGVPAPAHSAQASLPRAASTADYRRMREAFQTMQPR